MAQMLKQVQGQAIHYGKLASTHGSKAYKQLLNRNKQYIVDDGSVEKVKELGNQFLYTSLASSLDKTVSQNLFTLCSIPKRYEIAAKEVEFLKQKWSQRGDIPLAQYGTAAIFVAEVYAWFCVGEIAGRGFTMTGYKV